jgi:putative serine esterase DUF676
MKLFRNLLLVFLIIIPIIVQAGLEPVVQVIGNISISVDAEGNNNISGGTIRVDKPNSASVRNAYLIAASYFGRTIMDGDVTLTGTPVSWDRGVFNNAGPSFPNFFHNVFADVTDVVKPIIDIAMPGISELPITEVDTGTIDGTILVVIFDDPNQTTSNSVILFFGGQDTLGDSFDIKLAESFDLSNPDIVADMGLGISFGFQGLSGTPMVSVIDVNGSRLTSSAGGEDDGGTFNGGLITVGGIGDSNMNPPPFASSSGFDTDDELYNMLPFVNEEDSSIFIETLNPTDDDNIFFGYFNTSIPAAILPNIPAPGLRTIMGNIVPDFPTIVLTHGLQEKGNDIDDLWTGEGNRQAAGLIRGFLGNRANEVNIVQYIWEDAFQNFVIPGLPNGEAYKDGQRNVNDAGTRLAHILLSSLGTSYNKPIHFIGHSLGTAVNAYATRAFLNKATSATAVQFTALDRPHHISGAGVSGTGIPGISQREETIFGYDSNFFANVLPINQSNINLRVDNYYAINGAGVGDVANGAVVYNHPELIEPNDLDRRIFGDEGVDNNHTGVNQWYRWTINPNGLDNLFRVCHSITGELLNLDPSFDPTLNPCNKGWSWSLNADSNKFPPPNGDPVGSTTASTVELSQIQKFGCDVVIVGEITVITCNEQSSPFIIAQVDIPEDAEYLSFEYRFMNIGDGDYVAVLIDDIPIWVLSGLSVIQEGEFADSGPIPIGGLTGNHRLTVALYGVGEKNSEVEIRNFRTLKTSTVQLVDIDIKPGSDPNSINPKSKGVIPVAILSTDTIDATTVNPLSVFFGPNGATEAHGKGHIEDVDGDGHDDLVLHFRTQETGIACSNTSASLTGETFDGLPIEGSNSIRTVGCK